MSLGIEEVAAPSSLHIPCSPFPPPSHPHTKQHASRACRSPSGFPPTGARCQCRTPAATGATAQHQPKRTDASSHRSYSWRRARRGRGASSETIQTGFLQPQCGQDCARHLGLVDCLLVPLVRGAFLRLACVASPSLSPSFLAKLYACRACNQFFSLFFFSTERIGEQSIFFNVLLRLLCASSRHCRTAGQSSHPSLPHSLPTHHQTE